MNNILYFGRNNIQMRPGNSNFLTSTSSNFKNNKEDKNYSQEVIIKEKLNVKEKNEKNRKKNPKYINNINLIIDCKKNLKKNQITNYNKNYKKNNSYFEKNDKSNILDSKISFLETEPNKINNNNYYTKLNQTKNKYINNNDLFQNHKTSSHILSSFYNNKNQINKISIKKNKHCNINFNFNCPKGNNSIIFNNNKGTYINSKNNNITSSNNQKTKYQSFTNINKYINKDFSDFAELSKEKESLSKIKSEISIKNRKSIQNQNKDNSEIKNLYLKRPLSSGIYLKTENNVNFRNNSCNNRFKTNYNLINITSSKEKKNSFSNFNNLDKNLNYQNYLNFVNSKNSSQNKINKTYTENFKKYQTKTKENYSFNQNDIKFDKIYLNKFYEETFNDNNENKDLDQNEYKNSCKINNDDIICKEHLSTNQSTYTNCSQKIQNLKKNIYSINQNNTSKIEMIENFEELHYFIVSTLQKGKKAAKNFE